MNRWILLRHELNEFNPEDFHYDLLLENKFDCYTWKLFHLPKVNSLPIKIIQQPNHRIFWLTVNRQKLTKGRGFVKRVDHGTFRFLDKDSHLNNFSIVLEGDIYNCLIQKKEKYLFCKSY